MATKNDVWQNGLRAALKRWLQDRDMSQNELAAHLGIEQSTISRMMTGKRPVPTWFAYALRGLDAALEFARTRLEQKKIMQSRFKRGARIRIGNEVLKSSLNQMIEEDRVQHILDDVLQYDIYELLGMEAPGSGPEPQKKGE